MARPRTSSRRDVYKRQGLSSLDRAASAVLNAGLLPITQDFIAAVTRAFRERGIDAEVLIVRSDSSLMGLAYSAEHAVETLLSGPAASAPVSYTHLDVYKRQALPSSTR